MVQRTLNLHHKSQILLKEMSEVVKGKNIMITGATSGIGLELVKSFSSKGANIIMLGKDEDKLDDEGNRYDPYFKPDFSRELFRSQNYFASKIFIPYRMSCLGFLRVCSLIIAGKSGRC